MKMNKNMTLFWGIILPILIISAASLFLAKFYHPGNNSVVLKQKLSGRGAAARTLRAPDEEWSRRSDRFSKSSSYHNPIKELAFVKKLPQRDLPSSASADIYQPDWQSRGPHNIGGRTRALGIDVANHDVILAAGVTGGLWRSTDGGENWRKVIQPDQIQIVTCIAQDTRPGKTDTWYYGTGERWGSRRPGDGLFKSTDNGLTWEQLSATASEKPQDEGVTFNWCYNIAVDPSNSKQDEVYVATEGAIHKSTDGGSSWEKIFDSVIFIEEFQQYDEVPTDVAVTEDGVVYATVSTPLFSGDTEVQGLWRSPDGVNWTNIIPPEFPAGFSRVVIGIAPSNPNVVYFLAWIPPMLSSYSLFKYTYLSGDGTGTGGTWQDLSTSLTSEFRGQGEYDMVVAVKPDNPDVVYVGGIDLFRSKDGFATPANTRNVSGSPGYGDNNDLHFDQHAVVFSPSDPDVIFAGNDGGVYRSTHELAGQEFWTSLNQGYVTTQFYCVALDHGTPDSQVMIGGTQDQGTLFSNSHATNVSWSRIGGGDGNDCAISDGAEYFYTLGNLGFQQLRVSESGKVTFSQNLGSNDIINIPSTFSAFELDPTDNNTIYYAALKRSEGLDFMFIWRNSGLDQANTNEHWTVLENSRVNGTITALGVTTAHRLYYGYREVIEPGRILPKRLSRIDAAHTGDPVPTDITGSDFPEKLFSNIVDIAIDPTDGNRVLVVFSGYDIKSLFYSEDGGGSWINVSGNLEEHPDGSGNGPSMQAASILPLGNGKTLYLVGGSTGLYSTTNLTGSTTVWLQEGIENIGYTPVYDIDSRMSDRFVAVATHGNGVFAAAIDPAVVSITEDIVEPQTFILSQNYPNPFNPTTTISYTLPKTADVTLTIYNVVGQKVRTLINDKKQTAGVYTIQWNGENDYGKSVASGVYVYRLQASDFIQSRKMIFTK